MFELQEFLLETPDWIKGVVLLVTCLLSIGYLVYDCDRHPGVTHE